LPSAPQTTFNASGKDDDPLCLPDTRIEILQQIRTWADGDDGRCIFWLNGWTGTGKSTIARTIVREYYDKGCLGASFFFSRDGKDVDHAGKFVTSIAVQLAQRSPDLKNLICEAISNNDGIVNKILQDRWKELILEPLSKLDAESVRALLILVIDALDECDGETDIQRVLQLLANARVLRSVRFRVLITSRPEIAIRHGFSQVPDGEHQDFIFHDISQSIVDHDIYIFLEHNLKTMAQKRTLGPDWPGEQAIRHLIRKAAGLFIWAATACRFIYEGRRFTAKRLSLILQGDASVTEPEDALNKIYITLLKNSVGHGYNNQEKDDLYEILREILGSIVILFSPLSADSLISLLHLPEEDVDQTLKDLHFILNVPEYQARPIRLHHPSFRDFFLDRDRCNDPYFWVDEKQTHKALADSCIWFMFITLDRKDICGLHTSGALSTDLENGRI
jgi:NACHT domain